MLIEWKEYQNECLTHVGSGQVSGVQSQMSSAPRAYVTGAIGKLLSGKFLAGLASLIQVVLDQFLGNAAGQESEKIDFHIICANNSLLWID